MKVIKQFSTDYLSGSIKVTHSPAISIAHTEKPTEPTDTITREYKDVDEYNRSLFDHPIIKPVNYAGKLILEFENTDASSHTVYANVVVDGQDIGTKEKAISGGATDTIVFYWNWYSLTGGSAITKMSHTIDVYIWADTADVIKYKSYEIYDGLGVCSSGTSYQYAIRILKPIKGMIAFSVLGNENKSGSVSITPIVLKAGDVGISGVASQYIYKTSEANGVYDGLIPYSYVICTTGANDDVVLLWGLTIIYEEEV